MNQTYAMTRKKPDTTKTTRLTLPMVRQPAQIQNGNGAVCSRSDKCPPPRSFYKAGQLTLAGWLITVADCPRSFENAFQGKTPQFRKYGKELLTQWRQRGCPCLGPWPPAAF